jgi:hypothetical protein
MSDQTDVHDGGCACGTVRYRMESRPLIVHCCEPENFPLPELPSS